MIASTADQINQMGKGMIGFILSLVIAFAIGCIAAVIGWGIGYGFLWLCDQIEDHSDESFWL